MPGCKCCERFLRSNDCGFSKPTLPTQTPSCWRTAKPQQTKVVLTCAEVNRSSSLMDADFEADRVSPRAESARVKCNATRRCRSAIRAAHRISEHRSRSCRGIGVGGAEPDRRYAAA